MNRRGFALFVTLWLLVAAAVVAGVTLAAAREGSLVTRNRLALTRGEWAEEGCLAILRGRWEGGTGERENAGTRERGNGEVAGALDGGSGTGLWWFSRSLVPSFPRTAVPLVDLGHGIWCRASIDNPSVRLNLNMADSVALRSLLLTAGPPVRRSVDSLVSALLDWRDADTVPREAGAEQAWYRAQRRRGPRNGPLADVEELGWIRGFDSATVARLTPLLTVRGNWQIDLNQAPAEVLATVPGLGREAVSQIMRQREAGRTLDSPQSVEAMIGEQSRQELFAQYQSYLRVATTAPTEYTVTLEGGVRGAPSIARMVVTVVPVGNRLAIIRREVQ